MQLKTGILNESVKYKYGSYFEEAWAKKQEEKGEWYFQSKQIKLHSALNDTSAFQVILKSDEDYVLTVSDCTVFMPQTDLQIIRLAVDFEEEYGVVPEIKIIGLVEDDDRILKADPLLHENTVVVKRNTGQPVWIELKVSENYRSDKIKGEIKLFQHKLFEDEDLVDSLRFEIDVISVILPNPKDFKFYLDLWQHPSNIARKYGVELWGEEHFRILENYIKSLAELGQKTATVILSEVPWSGQRCYSVLNNLSNMFEYNIVKVEKDEKDQWKLDYTYLDKYLELCFKYGIDKEIEVIGLLNIWHFPQDGFGCITADYPDSIRIRYYDRKSSLYRFINKGEDIRYYISSIEKHFIDKGWIELVRVMADEPHDEIRFSESIKAIKEVAPSLKYKAAIGKTVFYENFENEITDFIPSIMCMFQEWDAYGKMRSKNNGNKLWYTACGIKPDSCIRAELLESRFIGWLSAYLGMEGFLRWNFTAWPEKPNEKIYWNYPSWPAGETCFVYPGNSGNPVLTLRYKNLKRGIRDFELIKILKEVCKEPDKVLEEAYELIFKSDRIVDSGFLELGTITEEIISLNYNDYEAASKMLLEEIKRCISNKKSDVREVDICLH